MFIIYPIFMKYGQFLIPLFSAMGSWAAITADPGLDPGLAPGHPQRWMTWTEMTEM